MRKANFTFKVFESNSEIIRSLDGLTYIKFSNQGTSPVLISNAYILHPGKELKLELQTGEVIESPFVFSFMESDNTVNRLVVIQGFYH